MKKSIGVLAAISGIVAGAAILWKKRDRDVARYKEYADKHLAILLLYNQWLRTKQEGKSVITFFKNHVYKEIAIYGMSYVGERLLNELKGSEIKVKYAIDKNADQIYADLDVVLPDSSLDEVDAIVVTSNYYFDEIEESLQGRVNCPVVSLEEILQEI